VVNISHVGACILQSCKEHRHLACGCNRKAQAGRLCPLWDVWLRDEKGCGAAARGESALPAPQPALWLGMA